MTLATCRSSLPFIVPTGHHTVSWHSASKTNMRFSAHTLAEHVSMANKTFERLFSGKLPLSPVIDKPLLLETMMDVVVVEAMMTLDPWLMGRKLLPMDLKKGGGVVSSSAWVKKLSLINTCLKDKCYCSKHCLGKDRDRRAEANEIEMMVWFLYI
ncbi:hypothetical protein PoB_004268600 [Plakobranchus ocellatus]|uniref:Uncharacterized protein n=1 Tax=Plakobranchus ocellatus TaxID=259542 RepID=A0AAV4AYL1_9GAST|nr:hypothetical protein PoB_004268600 [Plakobranchus ocellatus]